MVSVLNRILRRFLIPFFFRIHVFPGSHRIEVADKYHIGIRQQLVFRAAAESIHVHVAVIIPGTFLNAIRPDLHLHVETGIVLILHVDIHPDSAVSGIVYQTSFRIDFYIGNGDIQNQLQKFLTVLRVHHDRRKHEIVFDR